MLSDAPDQPAIRLQLPCAAHTLPDITRIYEGPVPRPGYGTDLPDATALPCWSLAVVLGEIALRLERRQPDEVRDHFAEGVRTSCPGQGDGT